MNELEVGVKQLITKVVQPSREVDTLRSSQQVASSPALATETTEIKLPFITTNHQ
jgi:hypothetical protein